MPRLPATATLSSPLSPALALVALLALAGCAAPGEGPRPEVSDVAPAPASEPDAAEETVAPTAPLLPSLLFAGGAREFQAWRCMPAQDLVSVHTNDELRLWSAHGAYRLQPAVVASGARFQHGDISFWSKGDEALVESANGRLDCTRDATRKALIRQDRPGVMFHARGNEPGWVANLAHDVPEVSLLLDYGTRELTLPYRVTELDNAEGRVTLASGLADQPFELRLEARACFDDMSGKPFPARVTLSIDGKRYRGCGQGIAP
ncbi:C-type lysozyme, inhibitor [Halomonas campisalis]|uniref:C-type lysozyme, inhibitor n=1 Tax=Billgrantia campisalis TaxID=74661 RepID=A0ABS9PBX3_9GAMM|nr:MliC family protein [Halomonas campisalis]MCG6658620.1 C-type lysozyme, inhibitor [Halomonas campisalis]MDR5863482.1 MliC family protein [Halomonas campisalis]